ncbi:TLD-domain-containing protein [Thamnidium elegans]|nr:TLD-domain-containing protein [Thamnidium elegans]
MGQTHAKQAGHENPTQRPSSLKHSFKARKYLTRIELVSLQYIFKDLKSTFPDGFTCIEPKNFLDHLKIPQQVEPAAVLLFKSFSYLGSYPNCSTAGPVPLSFEAFITAFVILIGRLDEEVANLSESLFFQSLSVLPIESDTTKKDLEEEPVIVEQEEGRAPSPKGYSLAELGVDFSDLDFNTEETSKVTKDGDDNDGSKILSRDLIELFVLLLWLGEADQPTHDFNRIRQLATFIVTKIKPSTSSQTDELPCISYDLFCQWKTSFSPYLFKPLQSFITKSFGYYNPTPAPTETEPRLLPQDKVPEPDTSDILTPLYSTLLSWAIPETILITKQWTRLYSADQDGFSMNRFESHVFKYPGPTLFIMQVEETQQQQSMILGAFITQPWKQSKHFWGSDQCFLFELDPNYDLFRPVVHKHSKKYDHYIYYHHDFGIGFGATQSQLPPQPDAFIVSLQNTLQQGQYTNKAYPSQPTFEFATEARRSVDFSYKFDTENIEVFGLGNEKDRERQAREWKFDQKEAERRSGLNIRKGDGELDKELLKMAGIIDEDNRQDR